MQGAGIFVCVLGGIDFISNLGRLHASPSVNGIQQIQVLECATPCAGNWGYRSKRGTLLCLEAHGPSGKDKAVNKYYNMA